MPIVEAAQQSNSTATTNKNLKNLYEHEIYLKLIDKIFEHKVDSTDAPLMRRELDNIQGFSK